MEAFAFKRTGDADYPRRLKIVAMGPPKSGKTSLLATAPHPVVADVEAGLMSIAHKNIPYVTIDDPSKLGTLITILGSDTLRAQAASQLGVPKIETFGLDTWDAFQALLKKQWSRENGNAKFDGREAWSWLLETQRELLKKIFALPLHVIVSVHVKTTQDDESRIITMPGLDGKIADELAGYPDFSIMTERDISVDPVSGQRTVVYQLKVEGDLKNPHLGNRAAGRLPEKTPNDFMVLHTAVFQGIDLNKPVEASQAISMPAPPPVAAQPEPAATPAEAPTQAEPAAVQVPAQAAAPTGQPAQSSGQPVTAAATAATEPTAPASAPAEAPASQPAPAAAAPAAPQPPADEDQPVNDKGKAIVTKLYQDAGFVVPNLDEWTMGKARRVARFFAAHNQDAAEGKGSADELVSYLRDAESAWVDPAAATPAAAPVPAAAPAAATPAPAEPAATQEDAAVAALQAGLGVTVVQPEVNAQTHCSVPEPGDHLIDDVDIAVLAVTRYQKPMCVQHYIARTKQP